jgi:hypothetical protein
VIIIFGACYFINQEESDYWEDNIVTEEETTMAECVALSQIKKISEEVNNCFKNLDEEEFLSMAFDEENKEIYVLYKEVSDFYDTRTEEEKEADNEWAEQFFEDL